jgi:hypothetical protein
MLRLREEQILFDFAKSRSFARLPMNNRDVHRTASVPKLRRTKQGDRKSNCRSLRLGSQMTRQEQEQKLLLKGLFAASWRRFFVCDLGFGSCEQGHDPGDHEEECAKKGKRDANEGGPSTCRDIDVDRVARKRIAEVCAGGAVAVDEDETEAGGEKNHGNQEKRLQRNLHFGRGAGRCACLVRIPARAGRTTGSSLSIPVRRSAKLPRDRGGRR